VKRTEPEGDRSGPFRTIAIDGGRSDLADWPVRGASRAIGSLADWPANVAPRAFGF